jgi:hypothetical protein
VYSCGGAEESKVGGDRQDEKDGDAAAALPHAVAPVGAPGVYSCAALPHAVAPVEAPSTHSCGGAEERRGCGDDAAATFTHAVAPVGAPSAAGAGLYDEWRGYRKPCCRAEHRRFRKDHVTRRDSEARRATFDNWRLERNMDRR